MYSVKNEEGPENYEQQDGPKVIASVQFPIVNGTIVNGTHKIGQKQFSLVNCIPTSWVRLIYFIKKNVLFTIIIRKLYKFLLGFWFKQRPP